MNLANCLIDPEVNFDTEICQCLDFDYLMSIILRNKYCVKQKSEFIDKREVDIFSKWMFPLRPARDYDGLDHTEMGTIEEMNAKLQKYEDTGRYYTSCWTLDTTEKFFYVAYIHFKIRSKDKDHYRRLYKCTKDML